MGTITLQAAASKALIADDDGNNWICLLIEMKWAIKLGIYWPRFRLVARLIETFSFEADRKKGYSSKILTDVVRLKGPPKMLGFEKSLVT